MRSYFLSAAVLAVLVGVAHSVIGEWLIFRKLRDGGFIPTQPAAPLQSRNVRILWATWHLASVFGFGLASILVSLANLNGVPDPAIVNALIGAFAGGGVLVLIATNGKHPGWVGLFGVAVLTYLGGAA